MRGQALPPDTRGDMADVAERDHMAIEDNEEMVLTSIRSFLVLETDYDVSTFLSAKEAISA